MKTTRFELAVAITAVLILIALLASIRANAKPTPYWRTKRRSGTEVYTYSKPNWGSGYSCVGMYTHQPIKDRNLKRYHFYRHPKTHKRRR